MGTANTWLRSLRGREITALVLGINGAAMLCGGLILLLVTAFFVANADPSVGIVVALREFPAAPSKSGQHGSTFSPVIRFEDTDGNPVEFVAAWRTNPPAYAAGDRVPVLYPRQDPNRAIVDSFAEKWLLPAIFTGVGIAMLAGTWIARRWPIGSKAGPAPPQHAP